MAFFDAFPIGDLQNEHNDHGADAQSGVNIRRFEGAGSMPWQVYRYRVGNGGTPDAVPPAGALDNFRAGVIDATHQRIQWLVLPPPGVTDYSVTLGRRLYSAGLPNDKTKGFTFDRFIVEPGYPIVAGSGTAIFLEYQRVERDPLFCLITAITGTPTGIPTGMTKPNNPNFPDVGGDDDGFVILWRPADRE